MFEFFQKLILTPKKPKSTDVLKTVEFQNVGNVTFCKTKRAKRLRISIKSEKEVRVTLPYNCSYKLANDFLKENLDWVLEKQSSLFNRKNLINTETIQIEALRKQAKCFLPKRLDELAKLYNFQYEKVYIKNQKTRWGSCSSVNNINLNLNLMRLPKHLIDYVILHELMHTIHKNHSKYFWDDLNRILPQTASYRRELKKYNLMIFN